MKPYGVKFVGPCCVHGCCWKLNCTSGFSRRLGHGSASFKKRERRASKVEIARAAKSDRND